MFSWWWCSVYSVVQKPNSFAWTSVSASLVLPILMNDWGMTPNSLHFLIMEVNYYAYYDLASLMISSKTPANPYWQRVMQWHCSTWFTPSASQMFQMRHRNPPNHYLVFLQPAEINNVDYNIFCEIYFPSCALFRKYRICLLKVLFWIFHAKRLSDESIFPHYCCYKTIWYSLSSHAACVSFLRTEGK